jgi:hypothetical protein
MDLTVLDFVLNRELFGLLGELKTKTLQPGESSMVEPKVDVDLCGGGFDLKAQILIEANPPGGSICYAEDR